MKLLPTFTLTATFAYSISATDVKNHNNARGPNNGLFDKLNREAKRMVKRTGTDPLSGLSGSGSSSSRPGMFPGASGRSIGKNDLSALHQYGCWCHFGELAGRGQPVDDWDKQCKALQDGYECIHMDDDNCNVFTTDYNSSIGIGDSTEMSIDRLKYECEKANGVDTCASRICLVEGSFIQSLISMAFKEGKRPNFMKYSHRSPMFDPHVSCAVSSNGSGASEKKCCGEHPNRFPYKTYGGDRQCCSGRTYNAFRHECCDDGSLKVFCHE